MKYKYLTCYINSYANYYTRFTKNDNSCAEYLGRTVISLPIKKLKERLRNK